MKTLSPVIFSIFLISSVILVSTVQSSFADEIIATSTGFEDSTILELKNSRGNEANVGSVRIWLSENNEFKSFKTEQGWMGKKQLNGVIEFTAQKNMKPGESVKFGIKTVSNNPVINWKALGVNGEVISSASTKVTITNTADNQTELNESEIITIKDTSTFRFIPEQPTSNSDFRVIGENFVPEQSLDFYIGDKFQKSISVDTNGRILFTAQTPDIVNDERTEFILRDKGGNEKILSIRIPELENREISEIIKLSIGNTPKEVKRGDELTINGMATPNKTITITSKNSYGEILNIDTVIVGSNGEWKYDNLFAPDLDLGNVSLEIHDGKSTILRNFDVISAKLINIVTQNSMYDVGDTVVFEGTAIPEQELVISLEDSVGTEIFSKSIIVGKTGSVNFEFKIPNGSVEGTYVLYSFQGKEEGMTVLGVGQEPEGILIVNPIKLNFDGNENVKVTIQGEPNAQVAIIIIDAADREKISDNINLGPDGQEEYIIPAGELSNGSYTLSVQRGESSGEARFTVGFTTGSGPINIQTTRNDYGVGDQVLILGNTKTPNVLLEVTIADPTGKIIKSIESYSDKFGVFKVDNFRIPENGELGLWKINAKSGSNFNTTEFSVISVEGILNVFLDKENYNKGDLMKISGSGTRASSTITITIFEIEGETIETLNVTAKSNGEYLTMYEIPLEISSGIYKMMISDGKVEIEESFIVN